MLTGRDHATDQMLHNCDTPARARMLVSPTPLRPAARA